MEHRHIQRTQIASGYTVVYQCKYEYRTDKAGNVQAPIGKASFTEEQLLENYITLVDTLIKVKPSGAKGQYIKSITVSTTMGPGVKIDVLKANNDK